MGTSSVTRRWRTDTGLGMKHREVKKLVPDHTARKGQSWDLNSGINALEPSGAAACSLQNSHGRCCLQSLLHITGAQETLVPGAYGAYITAVI